MDYFTYKDRLAAGEISISDKIDIKLFESEVAKSEALDLKIGPALNKERSPIDGWENSDGSATFVGYFGL